MAKNEIDILLSLNDKASKGLDKFSSKTKSMTDTFKNSAVEINAKIALMRIALTALSKALEFVERGAKFEQQRQAFERLAKSAGISASEVTRAMQDMSGGTVSAADAMAGATKAMVLGLAPDKLPKLMEIARVSARAFGTDVGFMFDSLSLGIGRQSRMLLDNLGIIVSAEDAYQDYADANNLVASALTDTEKKQAFLNAALKAGQDQIDKMGDSTLTQAEKIGKMKAAWEDLVNTLAVIASKLVQVQFAIDIAGRSIEALTEALDGINKIDVELDKAFSSDSEALNNANKALVKLSNERDAYQKRIERGQIGGQVAQDRLNDMLIEEQRLRETILKLRGSDEAQPLQGPRRATPEEALEFSNLEKLKEEQEQELQAILDFQQELAIIEDDELARKITKLEEEFKVEQSFEEKKLEIARKAQKEKEKIEKAKVKLEKKINDDLLNSTKSFLAAGAEEHKGFAIALKALRVGEIIMNTQKTLSLISATYPPPTDVPWKAKAIAEGAFQVATVAATSFADGGIVKARPGGILAQIGEAGQDEAVIPLDKAGGIGFGDINIIIEGGINPGGSSVDEMAEQLGFAFEKEVRTARGF